MLRFPTAPHVMLVICSEIFVLFRRGSQRGSKNIATSVATDFLVCSANPAHIFLSAAGILSSASDESADLVPFRVIGRFGSSQGKV